MKIKIVNLSPTLPLPEYKTSGAAGFDIQLSFDNIEDSKFYSSELEGDFELSLIALKEFGYILEPHETVLLPSNLKVEVPEGYELQVRPRSGLSLKGIVQTNSIGTIDSDYRGVVGIMLTNITDRPYTLNHGQRVAQGVVSKIQQVSFEEVKSLSETERGSGGFGHTGE